jgi:heme/copper-type cytochrome/quinol oxidase subunit 4
MLSQLTTAFCAKMPEGKVKDFFLNDERGNVLALVVTLISLAVVLVVGIMVIYNLDTTTDAMDLGTTGNETRDSLFTNINTAITLTIIVPIIAGAGLLIAVVIAYLGKST